MINDHHLNDYIPADRALERLRQAKVEARKEARREWRWCLAFAGLVAVALKLAGAI